MYRDRALEIVTYIGVFLAIWVVSPLAGKFIDALFFGYHKIFADSPFILGLGILFILIGSIIVGWTIYLFKMKGKGTPNPKLPPKTLIVIGPYKYSRNLMALGGFLTLIGEAVVYYSPSLLVIAILFGVIVYFNAMFVEEPELRKRFGEPYEGYFEQVPRFFPNPSKVSKKSNVGEKNEQLKISRNYQFNFSGYCHTDRIGRYNAILVGMGRNLPGNYDYCATNAAAHILRQMPMQSPLRTHLPRQSGDGVCQRWPVHPHRLFDYGCLNAALDWPAPILAVANPAPVWRILGLDWNRAGSDSAGDVPQLQ